MNKNKNLYISTTRSNNNWESEENDDDDQSDIHAPPSSPPPPHLIYFPESSSSASTYYDANSNKSWQNKRNPYINHPISRKRNHHPIEAAGEEEENKKKQRLSVIFRRHIYTFAKTILKFIFKNNNLLLFATLVNKLWKARLQFIQPTCVISKQAWFFVRHAQYEQVVKFSVDFVLYHLKKIAATITTQQQKHIIQQQATRKNNKGAASPLGVVILVRAATVSRALVVLKKMGPKWIHKALRNMGGLDGIVLAVSTIAFTKSIQRSDRIF